jgi:hypothetical protein
MLHHCIPIIFRVYNVHRDGRGRDRMVVGFTTTCAISAYHYYKCELEPRSWYNIM